MKELNTTKKYSKKQQDLVLSEVECGNVVFSNIPLYTHSTSESSNIEIFKDIIWRDFGMKVSNEYAKKEMNKLLEVYRNIIKNKRNICMKNMRS